MASFDFLSHVYETFGFQFKLVLSTRNPKKFIGKLETWNAAEAALASALDARIGPGNWTLNPEDGAFYGPKVRASLNGLIIDRYYHLGCVETRSSMCNDSARL